MYFKDNYDSTFDVYQTVITDNDWANPTWAVEDIIYDDATLANFIEGMYEFLFAREFLRRLG